MIIKLNIPCGFPREFKDLNTLKMWRKLHCKKCDKCRKSQVSTTIIESEMGHTSSEQIRQNQIVANKLKVAKKIR